MNKKLFVDLDDTLIDTASMKEELYKLFEPVVPREAVRELYREMRKSGGVDYNHLTSMFAPYGISAADVMERVDQLYDRSKEFEIAGRIAWLEERFPHANYEWYVFTLGDRSIQQRKITSLGLREIFDRVIIVDREKAQVLKDLLDSDEAFVVVDDRGEVLEEIRQAFPRSEAYQAREKEDNPELYVSEADMHREGGIK